MTFEEWWSGRCKNISYISVAELREAWRMGAASGAALAPTGRSVRCGAYVFDLRSRQASRHGRIVPLAPKEFDLAVLLFRNMDRVVTRDHLVAAVWGRDLSPQSRTVDSHISRTRTKLGLNGEHGLKLVPVYTHGYRLQMAGTAIANEQGALA
ncbi:winged helix-turn-helix domain-containing protein [Cupriavidus taiwanensis]|nr:response regulator transcription factor [Cupriavidus taiwanensis]